MTLSCCRTLLEIASSQNNILLSINYKLVAHWTTIDLFIADMSVYIITDKYLQYCITLSTLTNTAICLFLYVLLLLHF